MSSEQSTQGFQKKPRNATMRRPDIVADITLYTNVAHQLFNATWRPGNIGLIQFSSAVARIYNACKADDPYAEWYLLKTYSELFDAIEQIKKMEKQLAPYFINQRGIKLNYLEKTKLWNEQLYLATQFSHMGAELLTGVDHLLRQIITLHRAGISQGENEITIRTPIQVMQDAFAVPLGWKKTLVTRADIRADNQKAADAKALFNDELPQAVLNREIKFSFLPRVKNIIK
jgi:integrating conjugative element protein (TIGR03761 family)